MDQGLKLFQKKSFLEAAAEFDAAYRAQPYAAFLVNAALAYQEASDYSAALERYKAFLRAEPNPPDLVRLKTMIAWLEAQRAASLAAGDAGIGDGGIGDAGAPPPPPDPSGAFRSQMLVESDPPNAPLQIYLKKQESAPPFQRGKPNPGWELLESGVKTPFARSTLAGEYHVIIDAFKDFKRSETQVTLLPGHFYQFKANLSQGEFLGFLRVTSPVVGAKIWLDDPPPHKRGPWGRSPHGALLDTGEHRVFVEAPGYEPFEQKVTIDHGAINEISPELPRLSYGFLAVDANVGEATVKVDNVLYGRYTAVGEALMIRLPAGDHKLDIASSDRKTYSGTIKVLGGRVLPVHGRMSVSPSRAAPVLAGALSVGAIVAGAVMVREPSRTLAGVDANKVPIVVETGKQPYFWIGGGIAFGVGALLAAASGYTAAVDTSPPSRVEIGKARDMEEDEVVPAPPGAPPKTGEQPKRIFGAGPPQGGCL